MSFEGRFTKVKKPRNSTLVPNVTGSTVELVLRDGTSVVNPVFTLRTSGDGMVSPEELMQYNYCYIPAFHRYYFISNIAEISTNIWQVACECDVLATFRDDIVNTRAFVKYAQSKYNQTLVDNRLPMAITSKQHTRSATIDSFDSQGAFALTMASERGSGETGCAQTYIIGKSGMHELASNLYSRGFLEELYKYMANPLDAVISCTWTPCNWAKASVGSGPIEVGGYTLVGNASYAKQKIEGEFNIDSVYVEYQGQRVGAGGAVEFSYGDYRNSEPYSQYFIYLPGVGVQQISFASILGGHSGLKPPQLHVKYAISPCTGDVTYTVNRVNDAEQSGELGAIVLCATGNMGITVPISQSGSRFVATVASAGMGVGSALSFADRGAVSMSSVGSLTGKILSASVGASIANNSTVTSVSGSMGGWSMYDEMYTKAHIITRVFDISDAPTNELDTIGLPLFQTHRLGDLSGFVDCYGAHVRTWGTQQELEMIAQFVNNTTRDGYGGIIIE